MLEELCYSELKEQALAIIDRTPMVKVKPKIRMGLDPAGKKYIDKNLQDPWEGWLTKETWRKTDFTLLPRADGRTVFSTRINNVKKRAWVWFGGNDRRIIDGYILLCWGGNLRRAMEVCGNEDALHRSWLHFFDERRKAFMEKEQQLVAAQQGQLKKAGRPPSSHGGVANLLKVLTKTMLESGATILSIAKMQYAVCIQAGIMLPDEFLTDVLVAEQIANGLPPTAEVK